MDRRTARPVVLEHLDGQSKNLRVPPFALCTYELFERYAEVTLREQYEDNVWAGYHDRANNLGRDRYWVRPDFLLIGDGEIIDCKYKCLNPRLNDNERADVYQIVSYSRHSGVLEKLSGSQDKPSKLVLMYPEVVGDKNLWSKFGPEECHDSFEIPLMRRCLYCPQVLNRDIIDTLS